MIFSESLCAGAFGVVGFGGTFIDTPGFGDEAGVGSLDNAAIVDEAAQRPDRVGAATESEQINVVAGIIVFDKIAVTIENVLVNARTGNAADDAVMTGAHAPVIEYVLFQITAFRCNGPGDFEYVGGVILLQVFFRSVPGAVSTDDDVGHVRSSAEPVREMIFAANLILGMSVLIHISDCDESPGDAGFDQGS